MFVNHVNGYIPDMFAPVLLPVLVQMGTVHFPIMVLTEPALLMGPYLSRRQELLSNWSKWYLSEGDLKERACE